jgi:hypothetical protein
MLTGRATEENRKLCLESGAALFLEKLIAPESFTMVFDSLEMLANAAPQEGFRGMMRRVGLQDVLQMECLGRKSSVLEVLTGKARGRIFVADGQIVHAECGSLQGEVALYGLLGLRGGEFNLRPFFEPPCRTISGQYEFLLMEAARLTDEGTNVLESAAPSPGPAETLSLQEAGQNLHGEELSPPAEAVCIQEMLLCSGSGELLYESNCRSIENRMKLLQRIEQHAELVSNLLPAGRFDRAEIFAAEGRIICQVQPEMRLFVHSMNASAIGK